MTIYLMSVSLEDAYGRSANKRFDVNAVDYATALTAAGDFMADLASISELRILWYTLATKVVYTDSVTAGGNRDEGVTFSVRTADNEKSTVKVPGPENGILNSDGTVDLLDAGVAAFLANYLSGVILVDDGETVTEVISGRLDE